MSVWRRGGQVTIVLLVLVGALQLVALVLGPGEPSGQAAPLLPYPGEIAVAVAFLVGGSVLLYLAVTLLVALRRRVSPAPARSTGPGATPPSA